MAKAVKAKKAIIGVSKADQKIQKYLIFIPVVAFLIKLIVMLNIPSGGWYGADGENYAAGVDGLLSSGFYSTESKLSYWPAGYPILLWPLAIISVSKFFYLISFVQTIFFAYATYFFTNTFYKISLKKYALATSLIISFNPTLSLSTLAVGYEAPIAACFMMIAGLTFKNLLAPVDRKFWISVASISGWFGLAIFMQPRFFLVGAIYFVYCAVKLGNRKTIAGILLASGTIMSIGPAIMIDRNIQVIDKATVSTNLGVTMAIGAGDTTSGGYSRTGPEVPCKPTPPATTPTDNQKVKCVISWYLHNPIKTLKLAFNKSQFFWSPWSGPLVNGTMARNPWLKIAPTQSLKKNPDGVKLVNGLVGKAISCVWIMGQLVFLFWGFRELRRIGKLESIIANLMMLPIAISWLVAIGTIGDHRFRVPTMSLSLCFQAIAFITLKKKVTRVF